jgi:hypothetical protein
MKCPKCGGKTRTYDTHPPLRKIECKTCYQRYITKETIVRECK